MYPRVASDLLVAKDGSELLILQDPPSKCCFYKPVPPRAVYAVLGTERKPLCMLDRRSYGLSDIPTDALMD